MVNPFQSSSDASKVVCYTSPISDSSPPQAEKEGAHIPTDNITIESKSFFDTSLLQQKQGQLLQLYMIEEAAILTTTPDSDPKVLEGLSRQIEQLENEIKALIKFHRDEIAANDKLEEISLTEKEEEEVISTSDYLDESENLFNEVKRSHLESMSLQARILSQKPLIDSRNQKKG